MPLICLILLNSQLLSQNIDLLIIHSAGKNHGMAESGLGSAQGISSIDLNPAGFANTPNSSISFSQNIKYYSYSLFNQRVDQNVSRIFDWGKFRYNFENILAVIPVKSNFSMGGGFIQKINPFIQNQMRAITWSPLFNQQTSGSVYALALSSSLNITKNIAVGFTFYNYFGKITSRVTGDNHGNDVDKWATLENKLSGRNFRFGAILRTGKIGFGFIIETPFDLTVKTQKDISQNRLYEYLFPDYDETKWKMPMVVGMGFSYSFFRDWILNLDLERQYYKKSELSLNLYEYGGLPNWKDLTIIRSGIEFYPFKNNRLPLRIGYAYIPQLYASNNSTGMGTTILEYENTSQNVKHIFTSGTTILFRNWSLNVRLEYARVKWHRDFQTYILVEDDYTESNFVVGSEIVYSFE